MISLRDVVTGFGNRDPLAEVWRRSLRGGGGGSAEITGTLPLRYIGNGKPLTDYMIYGNTVQDGTPLPESPVDAVGCGVWDETRQSYKLPLTVNGVEYTIYLGQVPTTRRIKKKTFTGGEDWQVSPAWKSANTSVFFYNQWDMENIIDKSKIYVLSDKFEATSRDGLYNGDSNMIAKTGSYAMTIRVSDRIATTAQTFKAWLSENPVTVWYVLAIPTTDIVNEPLMKINDYADTISFAQSQVTIPTVSGANVLDMTSPVKPSEVYIKGNGIKPTNDPNFENGG